jgi:signal transduction histidine kinase
MIGSAPALLRNQELVLEALQKRLDQSTIDRIRIESELVAVGQQVASRLQANARGEFLVRVLRLQRALDRNDTQGALKAVRALHDSLTHQVLPGEQPGNEELLAFLDNWRGFVDIEHNVSELEVPEGLRAPLNTLVMEAVANAIRHGGARWIRITVAPEGDDWVLTVSDDGEATSEEVPTPGVGTNVWDRLTEGHWSLEHDPSGLTTLTARLQP